MSDDGFLPGLEPAKLSSDDVQLLRKLNEYGPDALVLADDLAHELGGQVRTIAGRLRRLADRGFVTRSTWGTPRSWWINPAGQAALAAHAAAQRAIEERKGQS